MRINVYAEELTEETELVTKTVTDEKFGERTFYGVRFYLKSPPELHDDPEDDDRSAITIWVPWTRAGGHNFEPVSTVLEGLKTQLVLATMIEQGAFEGLTETQAERLRLGQCLHCGERQGFAIAWPAQIGDDGRWHGWVHEHCSPAFEKEQAKR